MQLAEVRDILDEARDAEATRRTMTTAIQALSFHQVLYDDTPGVPGEVMGFIRRHRLFLQAYFAAAGYELVIAPRERMAALVAGEAAYGWRQMRLRKDETIVMIALRLILAEGFRAGTMTEAGRVETDTDELHDMIRTVARSEPPPEARMTEILKLLRRKGAVRIGDRDRLERVTPITVLPGIDHIVPEKFVEGVIHWLELGAPDDLFDFLAARAATGTAQTDAADSASPPADADPDVP